MLGEMGIRLFEAASQLAGDARSPPVFASPGRRSPNPSDTPGVVLPTGARLPSDPAAPRASREWPKPDSTESGGDARRAAGGRRDALLCAGEMKADWMVVGDPPDEDQDPQAEPFVGEAGELLDNMLRALGLSRQVNVHLSTLLNYPSPASREPRAGEAALVEPLVRRQVQHVRPRIILIMGRIAAQTLLQTSEPMGKLRGRAHQFDGVPVVVTYHPSYLLRNPADKSKAWADLCLAQQLMAAASAMPCAD